MSKRFWLSVVLVLMCTVASGAGTEPAGKPAEVARPNAGDSAGAAHFAWYLFVQATTPLNGSLTFESWMEQCQLNPLMIGCPPPSATANKGRVPHGSALAKSLRRSVTGVAGESQGGIECNAMQTAPLNGYAPPKNVTATAQFCEEVFVNASESDFVEKNGLKTLTGQQTYAKANGGTVTFPWTAVEIKADWVPTTSFANPTFQCPDPTNTLYTETINGTCYALVGLHISSKVLPDWLWATFEPASAVTNPNRCDPNLYDTCFDPWGTTSATPYGKGQTVPQSAALKQLMAAEGLNKAFNNYYLTGVQTQFVNSKGATPLGSSFVEFNAGVNPGQASCITCHRYAYFDGQKPAAGAPENNFGGPIAGWSSVGNACSTNPSKNCTPVSPNSISQDFSWMLGLMPYQ
ncbi:MAG: hypothetical protein ABI411_17080 [Tahibacter sp.]